MLEFLEYYNKIDNIFSEYINILIINSVDNGKSKRIIDGMEADTNCIILIGNKESNLKLYKYIVEDKLKILKILSINIIEDSKDIDSIINNIILILKQRKRFKADKLIDNYQKNEISYHFKYKNNIILILEQRKRFKADKISYDFTFSIDEDKEILVSGHNTILLGMFFNEETKQFFRKYLKYKSKYIN